MVINASAFFFFSLFVWQREQRIEFQRHLENRVENGRTGKDNNDNKRGGERDTTHKK